MRIRSVLRPLATAVTWPPLAGGLAFVVAFALLRGRGAYETFELARDVLIERYFGLLVRTLVLVGLAHAVLGTALGLAASVVLRAWDEALGRAPARWRRWLEVLLLVVLFEAWRLLIVLLEAPAVFLPWIDEQGSGRPLQEWATEHLTPQAVAGAGWAATLLFTLMPLAVGKVRELVRRAGAKAWRDFEGSPGARSASGVLAVVLLGVALARLGGQPASPASPRPNVLVIFVDSLRADRVGPGREAVAPRLARFAAEGVRFERALVTLPRTYGSTSTLLTGRWPLHHGIRHMFPSVRRRTSLGPTLVRALRERGYSTTVATEDGTNPLRSIDYGFTDPPAEVRADMRNEILSALLGRNLALLPLTTTALAHRLVPPLQNDWYHWDPEALTDRAIGVLREKARAQPFFLLTAFLTPHLPYAAPWPYYRTFGRRDYHGRFRFYAPVLAVRPPPPEDLEQIRALYDACVAATDAAVGRLLDALAESDLDRRTIVVLLADHGDHLGELGRGLGHGDHLHGDAALHVPLVIRDPVHGFVSHAVPGIVRDVDLAPTLAALCDVPYGATDGVDLGPVLRGEVGDLGLPAYAESDQLFNPSRFVGAPDRIPYPPCPEFLTLEGDALAIDPELEDLTIAVKERALREGTWKLIYRPTRRGANLQLYDLARDPEELVDVAAREPERLEAMRQRLYRWMTQDGSVVEGGLVVPRAGFRFPP